MKKLLLLLLITFAIPSFASIVYTHVNDGNHDVYRPSNFFVYAKANYGVDIPIVICFAMTADGKHLSDDVKWNVRLNQNNYFTYEVDLGEFTTSAFTPYGKGIWDIEAYMQWTGSEDQKVVVHCVTH